MNQGQPIYIIADDLTGAADAANYFRTNHRRVRVSFSPSAPWLLSLGKDVVQVFDAESRALTPDEAGRRVSTAATQLHVALGNSYFLFKKIDSTLRGHVGSEIESLLRATHRTTAILAPSFPANGRTVERGRLFVNGEAVTQTAFAKDPHNPVTSDKVSEIVQQTTSLPVVEIGSDIIAQGQEAIAAAIESASVGETIIVLDAQSAGDLEQIARAVAYNPSIVPCGSAGLAKQLAVLWHTDSADTETLADAFTPSWSSETVRTCDRVFIAVGSANPVSHEQLEHATRTLGAPMVEVNAVRLASRTLRFAEMEQMKAEIDKVSHHSVVGVSLSMERAVRDTDLPGTFEGDLAEVVVHASNDVVTGSKPSIGFVATGGDTALALCQALTVSALWPEGEVVPGVPWSWIENQDGTFLLVTKAGGFGDSEALKIAAEFLLGETTQNRVSLT